MHLASRAFLLAFCASALVGAGCESNTRRPGSSSRSGAGGGGGGGGGTADSGAGGQTDAGGGGGCACNLTPDVCDQGCTCDPVCGGGGFDAGNNTCACDVVPGVCDNGCGCDPQCGGSPDGGGGVDCSGNPRGCVPFELRSPVDCACLGACEAGYRYDVELELCVPTGGPGRDAGFPDTGTPSRDAGFPFPDAGGGGDPVDVASVASRFAQAQCGFIQRCEPANLQFRRQQVSDCVAEETARLLSIYGAYARSVQLGYSSFSRSQLDACVAALGTRDCDFGVGGVPACDAMFTGLRQAGQGCALADECTTGLYCDAAPGQCGLCRARAGVGVDCSQALCRESDVCVNAGAQTICVPFADLNQPCGTIQTGLCRGQLQCVGGTCRRPAGSGQTCDPMQSTAADCNIFRNLICDQGSCTTFSFVGPGGTCTPPTLCDDRAICNQGTGNCDAAPSVGQACQADRCGPGAVCVNAVCRALTGPGSSCSGDTCQPGLFCIQGSCQQLPYNTCP